MALDATEKALDFASETSKQMITLATAIVTFTVTFVKDIGSSGGAKAFLVIAWAACILSILAGVLMSMALTGVVAKAASAGVVPSPWARNVKALARVQVALFAIAIGATAGFGVSSFRAPERAPQEHVCIQK
jgi:hypothetical protein